MTDFNTEETELKVVFQGNTSVGKTSIIERYVNGFFGENVQSTCGAMFFSKALYVNNERYKLQLWDTAGQEKFKAITPLYYRDAQGIMICCDITQPVETIIDTLKDWVHEVKENANEKDYVICLVGNKSDQVSDAQLTLIGDTMKKYAASIKCSYLITSAKAGNNIEESFEQIVKDWSGTKNVEEHKSKINDVNKSKQDPKRFQSKLIEPEKKGCCK